MKKIIIGADRSGRSLKDGLVEYLESIGYEVKDVGMVSEEEFKAYYDVAPLVAKAIQNKEYEKGILCCGTGAGMNIIANKFKGVYAVAVEGSYTARMSSIINSANVLTLGGWVLAPQQAIDMVDRWLNTAFTETFEQKAEFLCNALDIVKGIEEENFK
jgi:ribose 5-phosphate isomerase B